MTKERTKNTEESMKNVENAKRDEKDAPIFLRLRIVKRRPKNKEGKNNWAENREENNCA